MNVSFSRLVLLSAAFGLAASAFAVKPPDAPYLTYRPAAGQTSYPWTTLGWWNTSTGGGATDHLPSSTDQVFLYSSKNQINKTTFAGYPMLVQDGVEATTGKLFIGDTDNGLLIGVRVCGGGKMTNYDAVYAGAGQNGKSDWTHTQGAYLEVEDGGVWSAQNVFCLGLSAGTSYLTVKEGGVFACESEAIFGQNGKAVVANAGTMDLKHLFLGGPSGNGRMEVTGTLKVASKFTIGRNDHSKAYLHLAKGATFEKLYGDAKPVLIANASNCTATVEVDCTFGLDSNDYISIGSGNYGTGRLIVNEGGAITNMHQLYLGAPGVGSDGTLELHGGKVAVKGSNTTGTQRIFIGTEDSRGDETRGRIVGHGTLSSCNGQSLRIRPYGQFIADGYGETHDLNLAEIRTVGAKADDNVNGCGTNGWFAVNKGRLIYPRTQNCTASQTSHPTVGDYPNRGTPTMMNSLRYTLETCPTVQYFNFAELYATDRDDIPAGLPAGKT